MISRWPLFLGLINRWFNSWSCQLCATWLGCTLNICYYATYVHIYSGPRLDLGSDLWVWIRKWCWDLADVTLHDEGTNSIIFDKVYRAIPCNVAVQVTPRSGQICSQCNLRYLVAKFATNARRSREMCFSLICQNICIKLFITHALFTGRRKIDNMINQIFSMHTFLQHMTVAINSAGSGS